MFLLMYFSALAIIAFVCGGLVALLVNLALPTIAPGERRERSRIPGERVVAGILAAMITSIGIGIAVALVYPREDKGGFTMPWWGGWFHLGMTLLAAGIATMITRHPPGKSKGKSR